jgi:hypothetical protein
MDLLKILAQLRRERELVEEVIVCLGRLATATGRPPRGRPPAWLKTPKSAEQPQRVMKARSAHQ